MTKNNAVILVILLLITSTILSVVISSSNKTNIITLAQAKKKHDHRTTKASNGGTAGTIPPLSSQSAQLLPQPANNIVKSNNINSTKVVMINFDDGWKSQYLYAKPILDQYGFKASFFIPCAKMQTDPKWMTWQQLTALKNDGMDIESHTMTHAHLPTLLSVPSRLNYEIGGAKQCLANHGFNTAIFGYPVNLGSNISSIVDLVAKYYDFARSGSDSLMFLNCRGFTDHAPQSDCRTFSSNGSLNYANRYDIRSDSFGHIDSNHNYTPDQMFPQFVNRMNSQMKYNTGQINAIPIIVYHNLTYSMQDYINNPSTITVPEFAREMKYLHDNGFKVLLINQFGYDTSNDVLYINNNNIPNAGHSRIEPITTATTAAQSTQSGVMTKMRLEAIH